MNIENTILYLVKDEKRSVLWTKKKKISASLSWGPFQKPTNSRQSKSELWQTTDISDVCTHNGRQKFHSHSPRRENTNLICLALSPEIIVDIHCPSQFRWRPSKNRMRSFLYKFGLDAFHTREYKYPFFALLVAPLVKYQHRNDIRTRQDSWWPDCTLSQLFKEMNTVRLELVLT